MAASLSPAATAASYFFIAVLKEELNILFLRVLVSIVLTLFLADLIFGKSLTSLYTGSNYTT